MFVAGLDLGQAGDFSALAILESGIGAYLLRHLQRFPLGLPYPETVAAVRAVLLHPSLGSNARLVVDGTGVGRPVVDLLRSAGLAPVPVTITGGMEERRCGEWFRVPKVQLVLGLQSLMDSGCLQVAAGLPLAGPFLEELRAFRVKINPLTRRVSFGGKGAHDDLVLATSLASWGLGRLLLLETKDCKLLPARE